MSGELNEYNLKFISVVQLLEAMCQKCLLGRDPQNKYNIIIYKTKLNEEEYGIKEGWVSQNLHEVASELFHNRESFEFLCKFLKGKGYEPKFTKSGDFKELSFYKKKVEMEMP